MMGELPLITLESAFRDYITLSILIGQQPRECITFTCPLSTYSKYMASTDYLHTCRPKREAQHEAQILIT